MFEDLLSKKIPLTGDDLACFRLKDGKIVQVDGYASCGLLLDSGDPPEELVSVLDIVDAKGKGCFAAFAKGDSMIDAGINDGDTVILEKTYSVPWNGQIVLASVDGESFLKYFMRDKDGSVWFIPGNDRYMPRRFDASSRVEIRGVLKTIVKKAPTADCKLLGKIDSSCEKKVKCYDLGVKSSFEKLVSGQYNSKMSLKNLHDKIDGLTGIAALRIIIGSYQCGGLRTMPSFSVIQKEFGRICASSLFYANRKMTLTEEELLPAKTCFC